MTPFGAITVTWIKLTAVQLSTVTHQVLVFELPALNHYAQLIQLFISSGHVDEYASKIETWKRLQGTA